MQLQLLSLAILSSKLVSSSPVPVAEVDWVTVTSYVTVSYGGSHYFQDFPPTSVSTSYPLTALVSPSALASSCMQVQTPPPTLPSTVFSGEGTYYVTGLGACGFYNVDTDHVVAISRVLYDEYTQENNPNKNTLCGKKIIVNYNSKSVEVTVVDRCEGCADTDLDLSIEAFSLLADPLLGRIPIFWTWA